MKRALKILGLLAGAGLFAWYLSRADLREVANVLGRLGWLAPVALLPYFCVYIVDCIGWRFCLPPEVKVPFRALFRIRWAGESVNNVLPSAYIGGETVKVFLLSRLGISARIGTSSAVVSKTAQSVAQLILILFAAIAFLNLAGNQPGLAFSMAMVLAAGAVILGGLFWIQRRGIFASLLAFSQALGVKIAFLDKRREGILAVDQVIMGFYRDHRRRFFTSTLFYLGGWLLDTTEIYLVSYLLGMPITWTQALAVEAFTGVAKALGMWVPGSLGIQESGIVMLGRLAGLPDTLAVAYALLRRAREVLFAGAGWLLLGISHTSLREISHDAAGSGSQSAEQNFTNT